MLVKLTLGCFKILILLSFLSFKALWVPWIDIFEQVFIVFCPGGAENPKRLKTLLRANNQ